MVQPPVMPPMAVQPNPAFLGAPGQGSAAPGGVPMPPGLPMTPPAVPAAPVRRMTPLAQGATYEQMIGAGWTDAQLIQQGMMLPA